MSGTLDYRRRWNGSQEVLPTDFRWNGRPLVVIDPEDADQIRALTMAWSDATDSGPLPNVAMSAPQLRMRAALRSLITTPKPPEPTGLGAVVEDADGNLWIRRGATHWVAAEGSSSGFYNNAQTWGELAAVKVLSDGVQP